LQLATGQLVQFLIDKTQLSPCGHPAVHFGLSPHVIHVGAVDVVDVVNGINGVDGVDDDVILLVVVVLSFACAIT
jgi:hypothetical protein